MKAARHRRSGHDRAEAERPLGGDGAIAGRPIEACASRRHRRADAAGRSALPGRRRGARHRRALRRGEARSRRAPTSSFLSPRWSRAKRRADFDKGYAINLDGTRALFEAIRREQALARRRLQAAPRLHLLDRRVRRAVPRDDRRRFPRRSADQLRRPEGDLRTAARRLFAPRLLRRRRIAAADDLRPARTAQQGRLRLLFRHHPRAALGKEAILPVDETSPPLARLAARGGRASSLHAAELDLARLGPRRSL